jgi:OmpA-OmpF porin, OOP family
MKKIITIILVALSVNGFSQFATDYVKSADAYFKKGDYYSAVQYYEKYLGISNKKSMSTAGFNPYSFQGKASKGGSTAALSTKEQAVYNIAECYRMLHFPSKAEPAYAEVVLNSKDKFPLASLHYATTLHALEKYEEAKNQVTNFIASYTTDDENKKSANRLLENILFAQSQLARKDIDLYKVNKLAGNDNGANYAANFWGNNILFTSTRKDTTNVKAVNDNFLYQASLADGSISNVQKLSIPQPEGLQQGAATISADGNTIYFTQWEKKTEAKNASIYYAALKDGAWTAPALVEGLNIADYSTQQPFLSGNTIYFSSNRPGGVGGLDLYSATIDGGTAANIQNLGFEINTVNDEVSPSFWSNQNTLVYSSNGKIGMGGFDLFYAKTEANGFGKSVNFGHPVNSIKDDIYFATNAKGKNLLENALISSDRTAACCLELFAVNKTQLPKTIKGTVVSCDAKTPIQNATVKVLDNTNNVVTTLTTDNNGNYIFNLDQFASLKAIASFEGLVDGNINISLPSDEDIAGITNPDICLEKVFPPPPGEPIVLNNIYFDYEKWDLLDESFGTLDYLVEKMKEHPEVKIEIGGHTDSNGEDDYNLRLSQRRAEACVKYIISKGIDKQRLSAKGYGESKPIAENANADGSDNPEGRAKNRRTEFKVVE